MIRYKVHAKIQKFSHKLQWFSLELEIESEFDLLYDPSAVFEEVDREVGRQTGGLLPDRFQTQIRYADYLGQQTEICVIRKARMDDAVLLTQQRGV